MTPTKLLVIDTEADQPNTQLRVQVRMFRQDWTEAGVRYQHFRGGIYRAYATALHPFTEQPVYLYRAEGANFDAPWFIRTYAGFHKEMDAMGTPRFRRLP